MMKQRSFYRTFFLVVCMIGLSIASRLLPHPANVTPLAAITLLSAIYFDKKLAFVVPLISLLVSDLSLGLYGPVMFFVYGCFFITALLGTLIRKRASIVNVASITLLSSIIFYLVTNFAVWYFEEMYPKTMSGLAASYLAGLPFFRNSLVGDFFFTSVIFSLYHLFQKQSLFQIVSKTTSTPAQLQSN